MFPIPTDSKALKKLIDSISKAFGTLYKPRAIKNEADAKAYEIEVLAQAKAKALKIEGDARFALYDRVQDRLMNQEIRRQNSIDNVVEIAANEIKDEQMVSQEAVDEDWIRRFFDYAQDVSREEMQMLWGKILAGEVKKPGSFSIRTLEILRNVTKDEADIFLAFGKLALCTYTSGFVLNPTDEFLDAEMSIPFNYKLVMDEAGLMLSDNIVFEFNFPEHRNIFPLTIGDSILIVKNDSRLSVNPLPVIKFTQSGRELLNLMDSFSPDTKYLKKLAEIIKAKGITVQYTKITSIEGADIHYDDDDFIDIS